VRVAARRRGSAALNPDCAWLGGAGAAGAARGAGALAGTPRRPSRHPGHNAVNGTAPKRAHLIHTDAEPAPGAPRAYPPAPRGAVTGTPATTL
jgi:hypothetical protein